MASTQARCGVDRARPGDSHAHPPSTCGSATGVPAAKPGMCLQLHQEGRARSDLSHLRVPVRLMIQSYGVSDTGGIRQRNEDCFSPTNVFRCSWSPTGWADTRRAKWRRASPWNRSRIHRSIAGQRRSVLAVRDRSGAHRSRATGCGRRSTSPTACVPGGREHDDYTGMGTTVVCALIRGLPPRLRACRRQPRCTCSRDGVLQQQTRDDTWAATILAPRRTATPRRSRRIRCATC